MSVTTTPLLPCRNAGDEAFAQLELDMCRLTGLFLLERLKPQMTLDVGTALSVAAPMGCVIVNRPLLVNDAANPRVASG